MSAAALVAASARSTVSAAFFAPASVQSTKLTNRAMSPPSPRGSPPYARSVLGVESGKGAGGRGRRNPRPPAGCAPSAQVSVDDPDGCAIPPDHRAAQEAGGPRRVWRLPGPQRSQPPPSASGSFPAQGPKV